MRLVSLSLGKVVQIYVPDEVTSQHGVYGVEYERLIAERYGFPEPYTKMDDGGFRLQDGRMIAGGRKINIHGLIRYSNAIAVETMHTDESRLVLADFMTWAQQTFGLRPPQTKPILMFESHVIVELESSFRKALSIFEAMSAKLHLAMKNLSGLSLEYDASGISLGADYTALPALIAPFYKTDFSVYRRDGRPYSENRFFCMAPLPTDTHLDLLTELDKELGPKRP